MRSGVVLLLAVAVLAAVCDAAQKPIKPREPKFGLVAKPKTHDGAPDEDSQVLKHLNQLMRNARSSSSTSGVGDSCGDGSSGGSGTCVDTYDSNSCEYGVLSSGLCPGPSNVECCLMKWGSCPGGGNCVTTQACAAVSGTSTPGECPGPYDVQCCTAGGPAPPPPSGGGNIGDLVTWANDNCAQSQGWECAEFAARAIAAGGFIPGLSPDDSTYTYASWNGYNLRIVHDLHDYLVSIGWTEQSTDPNALQAGWPIFGCAGYCPSGGWEHTCIGVGPGTVDCHNNERCDVSAAGEFAFCSSACVVNSILAPP